MRHPKKMDFLRFKVFKCYKSPAFLVSLEHFNLDLTALQKLEENNMI